MTKNLLIVIAILFSGTAFAQTPVYNEAKAYLTYKGYSISKDMYADLKEGETTSYTKTFSANLDYIIIALSDDTDVKDVDVFLYETNGTEYTKDSKAKSMAIVEFSLMFERELKVTVKNYKSNSPTYASKCKFIIGYKSK